MVRAFGRGKYVIPQVCTRDYFDEQIKPGMMEAMTAIKSILGERGLSEIPIIEFKIMTIEALMIRELGWDSYKKVTQAGLLFSGRGSK